MKIAFVWSMSGPKAWNDSTLESGLGGSSAMMVLRARAFAAMGHEVTCYAPGNSVPTVAHGVTWKSLPEWPFPIEKWHDFHTDALISLRRAGWGPQDAHVRALWANDHGCFDLEEAVARGECNLIITISEFQKWLYQRKYPSIPEHMYLVSSAGVEFDAYSAYPEKDPFLCMYSSTPERGLRQLIRLWTPIQQRVPEAQLVITGGFELYGWSPERVNKFSEGLYGIASYLPNTKVLGPISRSELINWQLRSSLLVYPSVYDEMCCIVALETHAASATMVTTDRGALSERVRDGQDGYLIPGNPGTPAYDDFFIDRVVELLQNPERCRAFGEAGRVAVQVYDHEAQARRWLKRFEEMQNG